MDFSKLVKFVGNVLKDTTKEYFDNTTEDSTQNYDIPIQYSDFPIYPGEMKSKPSETNTPNYDRLTLLYKGNPKSEYGITLVNAGFYKSTNVRYDKDNMYVIVEPIGRNTKIAYHIKK